jgi:hypothetical protein
MLTTGAVPGSGGQRPLRGSCTCRFGYGIYPSLFTIVTNAGGRFRGVPMETLEVG